MTEVCFWRLKIKLVVFQKGNTKAWAQTNAAENDPLSCVFLSLLLNFT